MKFRLLTLALALGLASSASHAASKKNPLVLISTNQGDIKVELDPEKAPISTKNFLRYVKDQHYNGTVFHRVIPNFMIQGGGLDKDLKQTPGVHDPIKNEAGNGLQNKTGTIAMARTNVVDSASDQFFINTVDNGFLDHRDETPQGYGYAVFGHVIDGMDVVHKIEHVPTHSAPNGYENVPNDPVVIKSVKVVKK